MIIKKIELGSTWYPLEPNTYLTEYDSLYICVRRIRDIFTITDELTDLDKYQLICIDNSLEAHRNVIDLIYSEFVIKRNVPEHKLCFVGSCPEYYNEIQTVAKKYNKQCIKFEIFYHYERATKSIHPNLNGVKVSVDRKNTAIKKKYINLTRQYRTHRTNLLNYLYLNNLLDCGYNSCPSINLFTKVHLQSDFVPGLKEKLPLIVDTDNFKINLGLISEDCSINLNLLRFFKSSMFSIITETHYENIEYRVLSEKIFKYVIFKHSFILLSVPNSLKLFKALGYKTFSPYINEEYDNIIDDTERFNYITQEIHRLCNLNDDEVQTFLSNVKPIVDYNYDLYMSKNKYVYRMI